MRQFLQETKHQISRLANPIQLARRYLLRRIRSKDLKGIGKTMLRLPN
jgi:hypothetical protein